MDNALLTYRGVVYPWHLDAMGHMNVQLRAAHIFEIHSSILAVREKTMRLRHEMCKSGTHTLAACTTIVGVHLDMNTRKGSPIPEAVRQRVLSLWPAASCLQFAIPGPEMNNVDSEIESERRLS